MHTVDRTFRQSLRFSGRAPASWLDIHGVRHFRRQERQVKVQGRLYARGGTAHGRAYDKDLLRAIVKGADV